jgi:hypothetical protein
MAAVVNAAKKVLGGRSEPKQKTLADVGLSTIRNTTQQDRLKKYDEELKETIKGYTIIAEKTPELNLKKMLDGVFKINESLKAVCIAHGGGGESEVYGKVMLYWNQIHMNVFNGLSICQDHIKGISNKTNIHPTMSKQASVNKFYRTWYQRVYLYGANLVYGFSWKEDNLDWAVVVNQPLAGGRSEGMNMKPNPEDATYSG